MGIFNDAAEAANQVTTTTFGDAAPDNRKEEVPEYTNHLEGWANRKEPVPEDVDTSSQDNNFDVLATPLATPSEAAEAAKDKGIIQLGLVAVVIAGTVGAYVWRNN